MYASGPNVNLPVQGLRPFEIIYHIEYMIFLHIFIQADC